MALPVRVRFSSLSLLVAALLAGGAVAAGCIIDWVDDCGRDRGYPDCKGALGTSTGGSTGTGGGTGSSSSGGRDGGDAGEDGPGGCTDAGSCPPVPAGPCASLGKVTCTNHVCGVTYTVGPDGTAPAHSQVYGNCHQNVCDGNGVMTSVEDDSNVFVSGNLCAPYICAAGMLIEKLPAQGTSCLFMGTTEGYCDQPADPASTTPLVCAYCDTSNPAATCMGVQGTTCSKGYCVKPDCTNGATDLEETDFECGGPNCAPCATSQTCMLTTDCFSGVCIGHQCLAPSCADATQNGDETDIDCGGGTCPPCADGKKCAHQGQVGAPLRDCQSGVCESFVDGGQPTCQPPSCTDGVKNGGETGIDCGGSDIDGGTPCPPCGDGGP